MNLLTGGCLRYKKSLKAFYPSILNIRRGIKLLVYFQRGQVLRLFLNIQEIRNSQKYLYQKPIDLLTGRCRQYTFLKFSKGKLIKYISCIEYKETFN